ncbi:MAG: hypothetical protein EOM23_01550 [Candidatus Moranbacteria bacterium]|nr:hypothetical protein [Candidatus Moranbacteria bacterium]
MDDYIYFLLLIGWVAYSFYQQNEKKKRKKAEMEAAAAKQYSGADDDAVVVEKESETQPDKGFKSILEELLNDVGEELELEPAESERQKSFKQESRKMEDQHTGRFDFLNKDLKSDELQSQKKIEEKIAALEKEMVLVEDENDSDADKQRFNRFNLRDAVIYSEILTRKY